MFLTVVIIIAIISVVWSFWSFKGINKNSKITSKVKKELSSGRVIYQNREKKD